jgi:hypothetical protein
MGPRAVDRVHDSSSRACGVPDRSRSICDLDLNKMKGYIESNLSHSSMNGRSVWDDNDWRRLASLARWHHRGLAGIELRARSGGVFAIRFSPSAITRDEERGSRHLI